LQTSSRWTRIRDGRRPRDCDPRRTLRARRAREKDEPFACAAELRRCPCSCPGRWRSHRSWAADAATFSGRSACSDDTPQSA
jgi:hypothetical protein